MKTLRKFTTPLKSPLRGGNDSDVGEVLMLVASYDEKNLLVSEEKYDLNGELEEVHTFNYDDRGNLIEHIFEIPSDNISERFLTTRNGDGYPLMIIKYYGEDPGEKTEYTYGTHAQPVKIHRYDADGEFEAEEDLLYDDQSRLMSRKIISPSEGNREFRFSYDEKGNLAGEEEYDKDGKLVASVKLDYDEEGKETIVAKFNGEGKLVSRQLSEYDELGRLKRKVSNGFYTRVSDYEYDELGRVTEEALSDGNGFVISRNRMSYDDGGRLLEETVYETDLTRAGRDTHLSSRYEYEFF